MMKNYSVTRVVAVAAVTCLLVAFATPVAAAPLGASWTVASWGPATFLHWVEALWVDWFGMGEEVAETSGVGNVYGADGAVSEPDGRAALAPAKSTTDYNFFEDGSF